MKSLKPGDKVVINPGILGTIEGVADDALTVRIADKTKIKVMEEYLPAAQKKVTSDNLDETVSRLEDDILSESKK